MNVNVSADCALQLHYVLCWGCCCVVRRLCYAVEETGSCLLAASSSSSSDRGCGERQCQVYVKYVLASMYAALSVCV